MNAVTVMSALAQPTRLAVFSLLAHAGKEGIMAGQLAEKTGTPANTMSAHLAILTQAGLVTSQRQGRNILYRAVPGVVGKLAVFLVRDCCGDSAIFAAVQRELGHPQRCSAGYAAERSAPLPHNILLAGAKRVALNVAAAGPKPCPGCAVRSGIHERQASPVDQYRCR